jgi:TonB family protein
VTTEGEFVAAIPMFALLLAAALQPAPTTAPAVRAEPVNPLYAYVSTDDYPAAALRGEAQGRVVFRLDVDVQGRVAACTITASSGSAPLDGATCRIMRSRVRFVPARDRRGRFVADSYANSISWALPGEVDLGDPYGFQPLRFVDGPVIVVATRRGSGQAMPAPPTRAVPMHRHSHYIRRADYPAAARREGVQGQVDFQLAIAPTGRVTACTILLTSGSPALDTATCRILISRARYAPARDAAGHPTADADLGSFVWLRR